MPSSAWSVTGVQTCRSEEHTSELHSLTNLVCRIIRSEEHTSELQSLTNLVCRLLLEKKKFFSGTYYVFKNPMNLSKKTIFFISGSIFSVLFFGLAGNAKAQSITSASGTFNSGSTITISGSGFGSKAQAAPLVWDTFENGSVGSAIQNVNATIGRWDSGAGSDNVFYGNTNAYAGTKSARHPFTTSQWNSSLSKNATSFPVLYLDFKRYYPSSNGEQSNYKPYRMYGNNDTMELFKGYGCGYQVHTVLDGGYSDVNWSGQNFKMNTWQHYQLMYKESTVNGADGSIIALLDGVSHGHNSTAFKTRSVNGHLDQIRIGHYFDVSDRDGCNPSDTSVVYTDNVYIDTTWARVELGNASTYAASTHREIQIPSAWSANSITATVNPGSFTSGQAVYLFVIDANGNASNGYPVTIGSGGTTPTCSNCCSTTQTCPTAMTTVGTCTRCCATACQTASTDTTLPIVSAFSVTPTTLTVGASLTASYTVTDNTALARAELWRAPSGTNCTDTVKTGCTWTQVTSTTVTGTSRTGTFTASPTAAGTFYYSLHAVDVAGNVGYESSAVKVTVNTPAPVCGNNNCETGETCSTCAQDCGACQTANLHYIRQGATGSNNGSDWTNAWIALPATLQRGHTYYIADGTYGSYTFDDAVSGTLYITVKKAVAGDHGTNTGWQTGHGDGQAEFSGFSFSSGYYVIDGQSGGGPGNWN